MYTIETWVESGGDYVNPPALKKSGLIIVKSILKMNYIFMLITILITLPSSHSLGKTN
jgi:hypothetical protein